MQKHSSNKVSLVINRKKLVVIIVLFLYCSMHAQSTTYYVDAVNGNDSNSGLSQQTSWKSLGNVNSTTFKPGDQILFKTDCSWSGSISPKGSGSTSLPIIIGKYGSGSLPVINGAGTVYNVIALYNQENWIISNLELTNNSGVVDNVIRRGVYIVGNNFGTIHNIKLSNLYIHDVNSVINDLEASKNGGGIIVEITGTSKQTNFDNLIIEGCRVLNVDRTGIATISSWDTRTFTDDGSWFPSTNVFIRDNWIERSGANGMIIRVAANPKIERNTFKQCGLKTSGNAMFVFNCDDALVQYNEASLTVYNSNDTDASAFDADYRCKRSLFQYNYSHDNDDGFMVVVCQGGSDCFNDGTIVRYNISQNDGGKGDPNSGGIIKVSGQTTNTLIYNNVIYSGINNAYKRVIIHKSWSAYPDQTLYYNNIIYLAKNTTATAFSLSNSTNNIFDYNVYYGQHHSTEPQEAHKLIGDPLFVNPGTASTGINSVDGYKLQSASPCINSGFKMFAIGLKDYWGYSVPDVSGSVDRGAFEYGSTLTGIKHEDQRLKNDYDLAQNYPNPFNPSTTIYYSLAKEEFVSLVVYNMLGQKIRTLFDEAKSPGSYYVTWNGKDDHGNDVSSGLYFATMTSPQKKQTIKMLLMR